MPSDTTPQDPATLLRNTLAVLHMRQVDLAKRAGLSAKHVNQIAKGAVGITPEVALKFEYVTGVPAREWNRVNAAHQEGLLRRRPRVWWSETQGVLEELPGAVRDPVRVIRVTSNVVLDELPEDAVELLPASTPVGTSDAGSNTEAGSVGTDAVIDLIRERLERIDERDEDIIHALVAAGLLAAPKAEAVPPTGEKP